MLIGSFRLYYATRYARRHLVVSIFLGLAAFWVVFGFLYPYPFRAMLGVAEIFVMLVTIDVICGPLLTLVVSNPRKGLRERWFDFSVIGAIQLAALVYGLYSVWIARPVVLAYEVDRLVVVTSNELQATELSRAPMGLQHLPWWGVVQVNTRRSSDTSEFIESVQQGLAGISPAQRPSWWLDWESAKPAISLHAKPVSNLLESHPQQTAIIKSAVEGTDYHIGQLRYLPMTSSKTKEWIALLDNEFRIVAYANVDGF